MSESSVRLLCILAGAGAILVIWPLLAGMSVRPAVGILLGLGLLSGVFVSRSGARRFAALLRLWLGVLLGGLGQWAVHAVRFPEDPYSFGFNFALAMAVVLSVAITITIAYLLGVLFSFGFAKLRA